MAAAIRLSQQHSCSFDHLVGGSNREKVPFAWHTLESMHAPVLECDARADDQVLHGARDKYFTGLRCARDTAADMHGDPLHLAALDLALTTVKSSPDVDP